MYLETLEGMRSQENSDVFFDTVKSKAKKKKKKKVDLIEEPSIPRKKRTPNNRTLEQYLNIHGLASKSVAYHSIDARENFRLIYFEVLNSIRLSIKNSTR